MPESLSRTPDIGRCNCPPLVDLFRHPVYTKPPCPVHPEPEWPEGTFQERVDVDDFLINRDPIA